jgi:2-iminobutanoate/2-iminopropanoate deaminase
MTVEYFNDLMGAPKAVGAYSQAAQSGNLVFLSGQIGLIPETGTIIEGGIEAQTKRVLTNIRAVLTALTLDFKNVVKTTIFLTDMADFKLVNDIYMAELKEAKPARSTIKVAGLPLGALVEIEMIAERLSAAR